MIKRKRSLTILDHYQKWQISVFRLFVNIIKLNRSFQTKWPLHALLLKRAVEFTHFDISNHGGRTFSPMLKYKVLFCMHVSTRSLHVDKADRLLNKKSFGSVGPRFAASSASRRINDAQFRSCRDHNMRHTKRNQTKILWRGPADPLSDPLCQ